MSKKCLDCTSNVIDDLESDMENEVPLWYKKAGNYSLLPKLLNREDKFNPNKTDLEEDPPKITEIEVKIPVEVEVYEKNGKKEGTWIFYWAALSNKEIEINGPEAAYGDEANSGLIKSDKSGKAELVLNCPQPYRVEGITYPRHVHYTTLTKENVWSFDIKTYVVYCHLDKEQFTKALNSKDHIIINALSEESFQERSIPGTYNLPNDQLNPNNRDDKVEGFIESHIKKYPDLSELIEQNKIDQKDIPIITYCANPQCNASKELANHIMNAGYSNVVEYPGGIEDWFDEKGDDSDTSDEENIFFDDDRYNLDNKYETIIIHGIKYKHKLDDLNYILDEDDQKVGALVDNKVVWDTDQEKMNHELLSDSDNDDNNDNDGDNDGDDGDDNNDDDNNDEKTKSMVKLINGEKDDSSSDDSSSDESSSDDSSSDDDTSDDEEKETEKKGGGSTTRLAYDGIYICNGGMSITKNDYEKLFRGWGFSFF